MEVGVLPLLLYLFALHRCLGVSGQGILLVGHRVGHRHLQLAGRVLRLLRCLNDLCLLLDPADTGLHRGGGKVVVEVLLLHL